MEGINKITSKIHSLDQISENLIWDLLTPRLFIGENENFCLKITYWIRYISRAQVVVSWSWLSQEACKCQLTIRRYFVSWLLKSSHHLEKAVDSKELSLRNYFTASYGYLCFIRILHLLHLCGGNTTKHCVATHFFLTQCSVT